MRRSSGRLLAILCALNLAFGSLAAADDRIPKDGDGDPLALNPAIAPETLDQETLLTYLVRCALPEGLSIAVPVRGEPRRLSGDMGLAPAWVERPLNPAEQRWVSACMLALTNLFGRNVLVSLRAPSPVSASLTASAAERARFTLFEGGFYGNIFADPPRAYACVGDRSEAVRGDPAFRDRVCTEPSGSRTPSGEPVSRCGFILTGSCPSPDRAAGGGEEIIFVFLEPRGG